VTGGIAALLLGSTLVIAAEGAARAPSEVILLTQLVVLMLLGRLLGEALRRLGQPSVAGMLLAGILLGPSALGALLPDLQQALFPAAPEQKAMLDGIAQVGILLLLLLTGMETDLELVRETGKTALSVAVAGVTVPFICGVVLGELLPDSLLPHPEQRLITSLFLGTALSISSIKIVGAIVREMDFTRRNLGQIIVTSAVYEDSIGWIIIAITFGLAEAGSIDALSVGKIVLGTAVFLATSLTIGRRLIFFLIRWVNDNFQSDFPVITTILVVMGLMALATHLIGVHSVLGAFVAGVLIGASPILTKQIDSQLRALILAFFMPVFFGAAGLSVDLKILSDPRLALMTVGLIVIASFGKFAGAFIGAEVGGLTRAEALALACGMNARGSTEVIIATIGLSMGALSQDLFTMIVTMAIATTMAMPPMLRWALARVPMSGAERARLEREKIEAEAFVPNLERLLLAVDESPNGRFAASLAGMMAARKGLPLTVLPLRMNRKEDTADADAVAAWQQRTEEVVRAAARLGRDDDAAPSFSVTVRAPELPLREAIANEARKGYDLLLVGTANTRSESGGFHREVTRIAAAFEGPLALVVGREAHREQSAPAKILVPVAGTEVSRRAAEVAISIARACGSPLTVLYVAGTPGTPGTRRSGRHAGRARREEQAIMQDIVDLARHYDVQADDAMHSDVAPAQAILIEAKRHDLIVIGVNRRPGDQLFFGETAAVVLEQAPGPIVFVAS
jgi:Kef-type K+ transport system membrane component KefB